MDSAADVTLVVQSTIRRRIADRMARSSAVVPHAYAMIDVDYGSVAAVRRQHGPQWRKDHGRGLSYLPFVARAVAIGIRQFPHLNGRFTEEGLAVPTDIGLGIAVDLDFEGLIVPVIPEAGRRTVPGLARAVDDLAVRARGGKLRGEDVAGGTFTLSNPGPYGARRTLPIINQPQVAILTVDAIEPRPAVVDGRSLAVRPIGNLTLAWDHRAFDGAYAASALAAIRSALESHDWASEFEGNTP
jgi:pyruvate dehydrogenase E2 component (dihydrolipoamide acetyltransferase)